VSGRNGQNALCACGSGKAYVNCCGRDASEGSSRQPFRVATPDELSRLDALAAAGRYPELEKEAQVLLAQVHSAGSIWKMLATSLWMQGKDALPALQRSVQLLPDDAEAHCNLGTALRARGRLEEAERCFRRGLEIQPEFAEAHNNLGGVLLDLARFDEAVESFRRALTLKPTIALFNSNLGAALRARGQPDEAAQCHRRALEIDPVSFEAHSGLGRAMQDLEQFDQALASYHRALALKPDSAVAHNNLGDGYLASRKMYEAEASYRRALALDPLLAEAHNGLGGALRMQEQRGVEAEASCRRALEIKPNLVVASVCMAQFEVENGRFAQAEGLLKKALAIDPNSLEALASMPRLRKMTRDDSGWQTDAERVANRRLPPQREANLRYSMGKYFDDVCDYEQAFTNYRRANDLSRLHGLKHDRDEVARDFEQTINCHNREWIARSRIETNASERPIFVIGMPRSGTTLAEQILASHPAVFGAGELSNWIQLSTWYKSTPLNAEQSGNFIRRLGADYLQMLQKQSVDARRVVDKTPSNFKCLGLMHAALPQARIIHLRRHPIDTCLSIYFQDFNLVHSYTNNLEDLAHYYRQYLRVMEHWRSSIPEKLFLEVSYEDLVEDQETWSRKMLEFVGLPWDPRCLDFHLTQRRITTFSKWQVRQPISKTSVARWRNYEQFLGPVLSLAQPGPEAPSEA
jgi:tetratricopeptide (TPR) repeat protein